MIVKTDINEVDVGKLRAGQSVNIGFDAVRGKVYQGVVKKIAPAGTIEGNIVVYPVEVEILSSTSEKIQNAIQKKLREYGVTPPESPPQPTFVHSQPTEEHKAGIELIKPGMTADLDIIIGRAEDVLCVPKEAITERDGRTIVMLIKNGKPVPQPVITGLEDDVKVEIKEGLKEGDEVLITRFERQLSEELERFRRPRM